jgi:hypothetical protein
VTTAGETAAEAAAASGDRGPTEVRFHHSTGLPALLEQAACALLVSTYQAGQVVAVGTSGGQLTFSFRRFDHAMGMALGADRLAVAGKEQVWMLRDHSDLAPAMAPADVHDRCWLPRSSMVTGYVVRRPAGPVAGQHPVLLPRRSRPGIQLRATVAAAVHHEPGAAGPLSPQRRGHA